MLRGRIRNVNLNRIVHLGKPIILEMNFKNHPDEYIPIGRWIILWDEIPARKIGSNLYEVYPEATEVKIETPEEKYEKLLFDLPKQIDYIEERSLYTEPTSKYMKTSRGTKRVHPWESPAFF